MPYRIRVNGETEPLLDVVLRKLTFCICTGLRSSQPHPSTAMVNFPTDPGTLPTPGAGKPSATGSGEGAAAGTETSVVIGILV